MTVPSLADLAIQEAERVDKQRAEENLAKLCQQWASRVAEAKALLKERIGRDADEVNAPEPTLQRGPTREIHLRVEDLWFRVEWGYAEGTPIKLRFATDKCTTRGHGRFCVMDLEINNLADLGVALRNTVHGVLIPGTTSHWHYDDHGHLISCGGLEKMSQYWDTWVERACDPEGLLPNGMEPVPYDPEAK